MNAILSIKPKYVNAILCGDKLVEFRKKIFKSDVERVYIYSSSPVQKIVGYFTIQEIIESSPKKLWKEYQDVGAIDRASFFTYFDNVEIGYSICFDEVREFITPINPKDLFESFTAPQSYCYTEVEI